jgi:hypothetical protein
LQTLSHTMKGYTGATSVSIGGRNYLSKPDCLVPKVFLKDLWIDNMYTALNSKLA